MNLNYLLFLFIALALVMLMIVGISIWYFWKPTQPTPTKGKCLSGYIEYGQSQGGFCCPSRPTGWNGVEYTSCSQKSCSIKDIPGFEPCFERNNCPEGYYEYQKAKCCKQTL